MVLKPAAILKAEAIAEHAETLAAARRFAQRCRDEFGASQVYLYGSRARDDWHRGSDCDVLVVSERFTGMPRFARPVPLYQLWDGPPGVAIEPVCLTPREFEEARDKGGLVTMALHDGVRALLGEGESERLVRCEARVRGRKPMGSFRTGAQASRRSVRA